MKHGMWTLVRYETLGNARDGYSVNDACPIGGVCAGPTASDATLRRRFAAIGRPIGRGVKLDWTDVDACELERKRDGKPLGRIYYTGKESA